MSSVPERLHRKNKEEENQRPSPLILQILISQPAIGVLVEVRSYDSKWRGTCSCNLRSSSFSSWVPAFVAWFQLLGFCSFRSVAKVDSKMVSMCLSLIYLLLSFFYFFWLRLLTCGFGILNATLVLAASPVAYLEEQLLCELWVAKLNFRTILDLFYVQLLLCTIACIGTVVGTPVFVFVFFFQQFYQAVNYSMLVV